MLAADTGLHHQRCFEKKLSYLTQTCFVDVFVHMWCILSWFLLYWIGVHNIVLNHLIQCCRIWNDNVSHVFSYNIASLNFLVQYYKIVYFDIKDHWLSFSSRWALLYIITYVSLLDFKRPFLIIISKELSICFNLLVIYFYLTIKTYYKFISVYSCIVIFASLRAANFDQWVRDYNSFLNLKSSFYVLCHNIVLTYNDHCYVCHNYVIYRYLLRCFYVKDSSIMISSIRHVQF